MSSLRVQTIVLFPQGFFISANRYNSPLDHLKENYHNGEWQYIGHLGWWPSDEEKKLYYLIHDKIGLSDWHYYEYEECDLVLNS